MLWYLPQFLEHNESEPAALVFPRNLVAHSCDVHAKGVETRYGILCLIHFYFSDLQPLAWLLVDKMFCTQNHQQEILRKPVYIL
jgi:hypothetical protein